MVIIFIHDQTYFRKKNIAFAHCLHLFFEHRYGISKKIIINGIVMICDIMVIKFKKNTDEK